MNDLSRRGVLRATAAAGVGAVVVPSILAAGAPVASAAAECGKCPCPPAELTGRIVRPSDAGYLDASLGWDELFSHYPLVIVFAQNTQDVVNALTWARQNDVALRVRSGRHSLEGWSNVDNGIVIDVSELKSVEIGAAARIATVGAGLSQLEAVTTLAKQNFAVATGTEGTVGLSGATLGGGFGFLTRWLGMACDSLVEAEVVVAAGAKCAKVVKASLANNSDLLWALRGAGNGNFGIVTSLTYKVAPLKGVTYVQATWEGIGDLYGVFDAWQRTAPVADDRLGTQLEIHRDQILLFGVLAEGTPEEAKGLLAPILSVGKPDCHGAGRELGRGVLRIPDPDRERARELEVLLAVHQEAVSEGGDRRDLLIHAERAYGREQLLYPGVRRGGPQEPRRRHRISTPRRALLLRARCRVGTRGNQPGGDPLTPQAQAWIAEFSQAMRPYVNGAYVNVPNIGMQDWETAYWESNFGRLREIKAKYDPRNVFQYEQSIPPA